MYNGSNNYLCTPWTPPLETKTEDPPMNREKWLEMLTRRDDFAGMKWDWASGGDVPTGAMKNASGCCVGRVFHEGSVIPGQVDPDQKGCLITAGGNVHLKKIYEVLCTHGEFVPVTPDTTERLLKATTAGLSAQGELQFIGRVWLDGDYKFGKVTRSGGVCWIAYNGKEVSFPEYEVFVVDSTLLFCASR